MKKLIFNFLNRLDKRLLTANCSYQKIICLTIWICLCALNAAKAQLAASKNEFAGLEPLFTQPKSYVVVHTDDSLTIDGKLQESAWQKASWTTNFVDIEGSKKPLPILNTQVKMLWNDSTLFIAAKLEEPQVWANQMHHDDIIFNDNDFEVFIDPDNNVHQYFEIEINALNKIFDLFMPKPYRNGGNALIGWDLAGLKTGVQIQGTLNNPNDKDEGWTLEMAIPIRALHMGNAARIPEEGTFWRINFSRVEWNTEIVNGKNSKVKGPDGRNQPENNWVWSPQGIINMHYPERWGYLLFTRNDNQVFKLPYAEQQRQYLWLVYYRQKEFLKRNNKYAANLTELGVNPSFEIDNQVNTLLMESSDHQFLVKVSAAGPGMITINDEGLIQTFKK